MRARQQVRDGVETTEEEPAAEDEPQPVVVLQLEGALVELRSEFLLPEDALVLVAQRREDGAQQRLQRVGGDVAAMRRRDGDGKQRVAVRLPELGQMAPQ